MSGSLVVFDAVRIHERSRTIAYAIDARRQRFSNETPYRYAPLDPEAARYPWMPEAKALIKDYNLRDLLI